MSRHNVEISGVNTSNIKILSNEEINRYEFTTSTSPEISIIRNYIDWLLDLPWNIYTKDNNDLKKVKEIFSYFQQVEFKSASEGSSQDKKDGVLILKRGGK